MGLEIHLTGLCLYSTKFNKNVDATKQKKSENVNVIKSIFVLNATCLTPPFLCLNHSFFKPDPDNEPDSF